MELRRADARDIDAITETITLAFRRDPVWAPALALPDGSEDHHRPFWRIYVEGGLRHDSILISPDARTVSVWTPPGETELSEEQEAELTDLVNAVLPPDRAAAMFALWQRFEDNHPHDEPHAYLGLLATHPDAAGNRYGQVHLATDLARWDAAGIPSYLESSNPANNVRYQRLGYVPNGEFRTVLDDAVVTTMWRGVAPR